jgi:DeoR/GlpR family transcriptional regulator of sugar metabolism
MGEGVNTRISLRAWRCYKELVRFVDLHGYIPSYVELSRACGCSRSTVRRYLDQLQEAGLIERKTRQARSIVIKVAG